MAVDQAYEFKDFDIHLNEDGVLGVALGLDLSVSEVTPGSPAHDKIQVRDRIIQINGELVTSAYQLEYLVQRHKPNLTVRIFKPRRGYEYINTQIDYTRNHNFGLYLKDLNNRVFAGHIDPNSLAYMSGMKEGDYFVHVHGHPVTKRDVAKEYVVKYIQEFRTVSMLLERACDEETKSVVSRVQEASRMQPPSVMMSSDIRRIVEQEQARMRTDQAPAQDIRATAGTNPGNQHVNIASQHRSIAIRNDNPDKKLQHIGKGPKK